MAELQCRVCSSCGMDYDSGKIHFFSSPLSFPPTAAELAPLAFQETPSHSAVRCWKKTWDLSNHSGNHDWTAVLDLGWSFGRKVHQFYSIASYRP